VFVTHAPIPVYSDISNFSTTERSTDNELNELKMKD